MGEHRSEPACRPQRDECVVTADGAGELRQSSFQKDEIQPASNLEADFPEVRDAFEAEALVEAQRAFVLSVDACDHDVFARRERAFDQRRHETAANSLPL
jgi:hypothetical protein